MIFRSAALHSRLYRAVHQSHIVAQCKTALHGRFLATKAITTPGDSGMIPNHFLRQWYNIFGKSTSMYMAWMVSLIVVGEFVTGKITDNLWTMNNYGKTFETVDWSKFDEDDEEGDDDDDE